MLVLLRRTSFLDHLLWSIFQFRCYTCYKFPSGPLRVASLLTRAPPVVFELLRKSFWCWAGFEPTEIERVLLSVHYSTSKPPRLDKSFHTYVLIDRVIRPFVWSSHIHQMTLQKGWALSFTLCVFCTINISCSLTLKERIYLVSLTVFHS